MKITTAFSTVVILLLLGGCDPLVKGTMDFYQSTKSIDLSVENINSISINSDENDVIATFGTPANAEEIENPKSKYLSYDGVEFGFIEDEVFRYYIHKEFDTAKEIKIGETKNKVIKEYGQNYYERVEGGLKTVGYFDKDNRINIEFGFNENKVAGIIIQKIGWREDN